MVRSLQMTFRQPAKVFRPSAMSVCNSYGFAHVVWSNAARLTRASWQGRCRCWRGLRTAAYQETLALSTAPMLSSAMRTHAHFPAHRPYTTQTLHLLRVREGVLVTGTHASELSTWQLARQSVQRKGLWVRATPPRIFSPSLPRDCACSHIGTAQLGMLLGLTSLLPV